MNRLIATVAALLVAGFVAAEERAYLIECTILDGSRVVGAPAVVAEPGKQVTVSVTDTYDLALKAEEQDDGRVALSTHITVAGEAHSPALLVELDRPTDVRLGDTTLRITVRKVVPGDV